MIKRNTAIGGMVVALISAGSVVAFADHRPEERRVLPGRDTVTMSGRAGAPARPGQSLDAVPRAGAVKSLGGARSAAPSLARPQGGAPAGPRVVKTATLSLSVPTDRVGTAADRVGALAESEGGFIAEAQRTTGDEQSARLTVRVPAARFESALAALRTVGRVTGSSVGGTDVTGSLVDLDARLRSLRVQEDALNALLRKANTVGETLQVAQAAGEVRTQIEQLAAQQAQLSDAADQATINVDVTGPRPGLGSYRPAPMLVRSVQRAGAGALAVVGGTIVVLGYAGPVGALLGALWLLYRGVSRRRRPKVAVA